MGAVVEIFGCDNSYWCVHGDGAGSEGVYLAEGQVEGIVEAPVETEWKSSAFQIGGTHKHTKWLYRDLDLGFHVVAGVDVLEVYQGLVSAFDYRIDPWDDDASQARIDWTTDLSGTRSLDVLMHEQPSMDMERDLEVDEYANVLMPLRAGQPMWYSADDVQVLEVGSGTHDVMVEMSNPTDQPCFQKWVLTPGTFTIPDFSWRGPRMQRAPGGPMFDRTVQVPAVTTLQGGAVLDLDPMELDDRAADGSNRLGQYNPPGRRLENFIPPFTPKTLVPVRIVAPSGGARVELRMPRRYSRPW